MLAAQEHRCFHPDLVDSVLYPFPLDAFVAAYSAFLRIGYGAVYVGFAEATARALG